MVKPTRDIPGVQPWFFGREDEILRDISTVLKSGALTQGKFLEKFEASFARTVGTNFCAGINSGGIALELILKAIDVRGKKVVVPTNTFVATPASVIQAGGKVVFADVEENTLCLDPRDVVKRLTKDTVAVVTVHMFGIMSDGIAELQKICHERGIFLIEDAAHAHGASYGGIKAGALGTAAAFSFFATKVITTGEGGGVTTNDENFHKKILMLRNHGRLHGNDDFDMVSNNYRLSEIPAILGCHQVDFLLENVTHRNRLADRYYTGLKGVKQIQLLQPSPNGRHSYWRFPMTLDESVDRVKFQNIMAEKFKVRLTWMYEPLCHLQPVYRRMYGTKNGDFPVAEKCMEHLVCLPCHMGVSVENAEYICEAVHACINEAHL